MEKVDCRGSLVYNLVLLFLFLPENWMNLLSHHQQVIIFTLFSVPILPQLCIRLCGGQDYTILGMSATLSLFRSQPGAHPDHAPSRYFQSFNQPSLTSSPMILPLGLMLPRSICFDPVGQICIVTGCGPARRWIKMGLEG